MTIHTLEGQTADAPQDAARRPRISVVVPTYAQRGQYLQDAMESLQAQDLPAHEYEIVVVDNSGVDRARPIVSALDQRTRVPVVCVSEPRIGLHYARHAGARAAAGQVVAYVDDDVIVPSHWLRSLLEPFDEPDVACVGGPARPQFDAAVPEWYGQFDPGYLSLLDLGDRRRDLVYPDCVWGCNMAVRRSALYKVKGFHPDGLGDRRLIWLRGDGECGLQQKICDAGLRVVYEPRAWLYHRIPASRLTTSHFYWRFFIQGIQDSFVRTRRRPNGRLWPVGALAYVAYCALQASRHGAMSLMPGRRRYHALATAWLWYGKAQHQVRMLWTPSLRRHVLRTDYLEPEDELAANGVRRC